METTPRAAWGAVLVAVGLLIFAGRAMADRDGADASPARPNILFILADDLGWRDVSYHGSEISTPSIDRIARDGLELDRFYAQPTCSPTRAALMTGKSPMRLGITQPISKNQTTGLPLEETILPQFLARAGYQTSMVGKWHLGHYTPDQFPQARGFEHFYGFLTGGIGYWDHNQGGGHDWQRDGVSLREEGYSTRLLADEAIRVLETRDRSRPLFLYLAFNAPHLPNQAPEETIAKLSSIEDPRRRVHAAMVSELDVAIGRVIDELESQGMGDDTLVFFASDNGGLVRDATAKPLLAFADALVYVFGRPIPIAGLDFLVANVSDGASDNSPLPLGKGFVEEGGVRVPAAVWWPGQLEGGRSERFVTASDVLPTLLDAIGEAPSIPADLDGASQWAALRDNDLDSSTPDYLTRGIDGLALYRPPWKLIDPESPRLYQIEEDPLEERDLAAEHPELVEAMVATINDWPRGPIQTPSLLDVFLDPDTFGGPEDRPPWVEVAEERASPRR